MKKDIQLEALAYKLIVPNTTNVEQMLSVIDLAAEKVRFELLTQYFNQEEIDKSKIEVADINELKNKIKLLAEQLDDIQKRLDEEKETTKTNEKRSKTRKKNREILNSLF